LFDRKIFAVRLRELRTSRNISQEELGAVLGVSKPAISDIERERRTTTVERLVELANYFDVSIDYLVGRSDDLKMKQSGEKKCAFPVE